jgi:acetate CoA/acetoacetate CoA-transferase beta subunit
MSDMKEIIAQRGAQELRDGQIINLGIGVPTLVTNYVPENIDVVIHSENGIVGVGPAPDKFCDDNDRANAGGIPITLVPGGSYFSSSASFSMIRGGHVDMTFLGTFQVDGEGNIASYEVPGKLVAGMGGAMDLLAGAKVINVLTEHCSKDGSTKLLKRCTYPLTGAGAADCIITERAVFRRYPDKGMVLEEVARGYTLDDIAACTEMEYTVADDVKMNAYGPEPEK